MIIRKRPGKNIYGVFHAIGPTCVSTAVAYRRTATGRKPRDDLEDIDMSRTFTVAEAETLLPVLESLLRSAIQAKALIEEVDAEQQALANRIFVNGGTLVDIVAVARRKAEREKALQRAKDAVAEIDAAGVQVKDLDIGLLDFPCVVAKKSSCSAGSWGAENRPLAQHQRRLRRTQAHRRAHLRGQKKTN